MVSDITVHNREKEFLHVYEDLADSLFRHCYFRLSDREKAKDLVQDSFKRLWEYMDDHELENAKAVLFRIANNLIIDSYRKKKDDSLDSLQEAGFDPGEDDQDILNLATQKDLTSLLEKLDERQRDILVMRYLDDLPVYEIAKAMGLSENVVSVRIHRALKKLRIYADANA